MSDEIQIPQVIDLGALLQPISEEMPSGESLRYSGIYDEISEARRADDVLSQGDWQTDLKVADYRKVVDIAIPALASKSKDLQVAVWLTEALVKIHGFAGLRDGLTLLSSLQETFWGSLHPEIDEGDMEGRANAISWLDTQGVKIVQSAPITAGPGYSFIDWSDAKRFDFPDNIDALDSESQEKFNDLKTQAEKENRTTADKWRSAVNQTKRSFCEQTNFTIDECRVALTELDRVIDEKYDRKQMPGLSGLKKALDSVHDQVKKLLEKKRAEEPDALDASVADEESVSRESVTNGEYSSGGSGTSGPVRSRPEALKRLAEIAQFFQRTEPHSPVAYLIQRAVKWGNMPLESWLQDVIKDENVLYQLRDTLGIDGSGSTASYSESSWEKPETESTAEETADSSSSDW